MRRLALALSLALALPALAETHAVVLRNGVWQSAQVADCRDVQRAWTWSDDAPPLASTNCEPPKRSERTLELQVVRKDPRTKPVVIAAPAAMWREVPEALLPRFEVDRKGIARVPRDAAPWRVRAIEAASGSGWIDAGAAAPRALVAMSDAAARVLSLLSPGGEPAAGAQVDVLRMRGSAMPEVEARFVADAKGRATIPALPDLGSLQFVIRHRGAALDSFSAYAAEFPLTRRLQRGTTVRGTFAAGNTAVSGVSVKVEGFVASDVAHVFVEKASSAGDGTFAVDHLPRRRLVLTASKRGFLPHRAVLDPEQDSLDLGTIELRRGTTVSLVVTDDQELPLAGASIDAGDARTALTDAKGRAQLTDVPADTPFPVSVTAKHHLTQSLELQPPFDDVRVRLQRAFVVKGRVVDGEKLPLRAAMRIESGSSYKVDETQDDGTFEIAIPPANDVKIAFTSASTGEVIVPVAGGTGGEVRDLGTITAPSGLTVAGRVIAEDGTPVAGARVWAPKQSAQGPLVAFMNGELTEATSGADGAFVVGGLRPAPLLLRIDAPGLARAHRSVQLDASVPRVELGDITLVPGSTVRVATKSADAIARLDLRGEGIEIDMISASVREGEALLPHVPPGEALLAIVRNRRTVCEKRLTVDESVEQVTCDPVTTRVRGTVVVGTTPAHGGRLLWSSATKPKVASAVLERTTPSGLRMQQAWGVSEPAVLVEIDDAGRFETSELRPGRWEVSLGGAAQQVELTEEESREITLRFEDTRLSGVVVDERGAPQAKVVVVITGAGIGSPAAEDGTFTFTGLAPGDYELRARARDGRTATERVRVDAGREMPPVRLVLRPDRPPEVRIDVARATGEPAAGAFVFVDLGAEGQRILTADSAGSAAVRVSDSVRQFRVAAYDQGSWSFGVWREPAAATVRMERGSDLTIAGAAGGVEIVRADGWNVSQLLRRIGAPPLADASGVLVVRGLASGTYTVASGGRTLQVELAGSAPRDVKFD